MFFLRDGAEFVTTGLGCFCGVWGFIGLCLASALSPSLLKESKHVVFPLVSHALVRQSGAGPVVVCCLRPHSKTDQWIVHYIVQCYWTVGLKTAPYSVSVETCSLRSPDIWLTVYSPVAPSACLQAKPVREGKEHISAWICDQIWGKIFLCKHWNIFLKGNSSSTNTVA